MELARRARLGWLFAVSLFLSVNSWAQQTPSGITGVVKDESGSVLPGVTVEAASPALIEKVRTAVTDGDGRYNIVDLRPGTYSVTFTLTGFGTFKRDGLELPIGFTASVNADLKVGSLEETITVTGETPLVDTTNVRQQRVVSDEVLTALPTGQASVVNLVALTPGMTGNATVGGSAGAYHSQQTKGTFHGKRGSHIKYDGMRIDNYAGSGDSPGYLFNVQTVEETSVETGGAGADSGSPNVGINMIPKEGGNLFRYSVSGLFTNKTFQADNLTQELRDRQLTSVPELDKMYDAGITIGGPISKDKVWFFAGIRRWGTKNQSAGLYANATQGTPFYTEDLSRPAFRVEKYQSHAARITWQLTQRQKLNIFTDIKRDCVCETGGAGSALGSGAVNALEAQTTWDLWPNGVVQGTWSSPLTQRLLLEAGASVVFFHWPGDLPGGVSVNDISILEQSGVPGGARGGFRYNNAAGIYNPERRVGDRFSQRFALSFITGSHNLKTGLQWDQGYSDTDNLYLGPPGLEGISYVFNRGVPAQVRYDVAFKETYWQKAELGLYAQDQWTKDRWTINYGVRFDYYLGYIPAVDQPAGPFSPALTAPATKGAPSWKDINPRSGISYDLFGNGRTALKASFGRYVAMTGNTQVNQFHPLRRSVNSATRAWTDADGDYFPDCDLNNFAANGECRAINNTLFGQANPNATQYAKDYRDGWGIRPYTWDFSTEVQHQLTGGVSLTAGYYRNWDGAFTVTDNTAVTPDDYSTYCVTAPMDPRLPNGGGYQICGLADINPNAFGRVTNVVTQGNNFGKYTRMNNFMAVNIDTRFGKGIRLSGGLDMGRSVEDLCFNVDSPGIVGGLFTTPFSSTTIDGQQACRVVTPIAGTAQVKANGSFPLPFSSVVSATLQNVPGLMYTALYNAPLSAITPSLGRPLSGGAPNAAVPLVMPNSLREPRRTQVDVRFTKSLQLGRSKVSANFDLYNVFNASDVLGQNNNYGSTWRQPTLTLNGRLVQFSAKVDF